MAPSCGPYADVPALRRSGCGMIEVSYHTGFVGWAAVFDEASGELLGITTHSDDGQSVCRTHSHFAGREFSCPEADVEECQPCGPPL